MLQERIASRNDYLATYMLALYENQPSRQTHLTTSKKEVSLLQTPGNQNRQFRMGNGRNQDMIFTACRIVFSMFSTTPGR
jgi:hypothetical protein